MPLDPLCRLLLGYIETIRPVSHRVHGVSVSAAWRVHFYFGSHLNRLDLAHRLCDTHISNTCMLGIGPTPIFHATRKRVGSVSIQNSEEKNGVRKKNVLIGRKAAAALHQTRFW